MRFSTSLLAVKRAAQWIQRWVTKKIILKEVWKPKTSKMLNKNSKTDSIWYQFGAHPSAKQAYET